MRILKASNVVEITKTKLPNSNWLSYSRSGKADINHVLLADEIASEVLIFKNNKHYKYFDETIGIWRDYAQQHLKTYIINKLGLDSSKAVLTETLFQLENKFHKNNEFDPFEKSNPYLIAIKNGTYNLKTDEFKQTFDPEDYIQTKHENITFIPEAECPRIEEFLRNLVGEEHLDFIYEWFGFQLVRQYWPQCFLFLNGTGGAGKSKLIDLLTIFVGQQNVTGVSLDVLMNDTFATSELYTKSSNLCADIEPKYMDKPGLLKNLTGDDLISANRKYLKPVQFKNYAKITFSMNSLPTLSDFSDGMRRRTIILPITKPFDSNKQNANIIREITTETELAGLFNKAIQGIKRIQQTKWFSVTPAITEAVNNWFEESDIIQQFLNDECEFEKGNEALYTKAEDLFFSFDRYRADSKAKEITKITFYKRLAIMGYIKKKKKLSKTSFQAIFGINHIQKNEW